MDLNFQSNSLPSNSELILNSIGFPILILMSLNFLLNSDFASNNSQTNLSLFIIFIILVVFLFDAFKYFYKSFTYILLDRNSQLVIKSTIIKRKYSSSGKSAVKYFLVDFENVKYTVSYEIYETYSEGEPVAIKYFRFSKYLDSIAFFNPQNGS